MGTIEMNCGENQPIARTIAGRIAFAALVLNLALSPVTANHARAAETTSSIAGQKMRFISLGIGKSMVIDLPHDIKDVLVANPKVANAVVHSPQRAYVIGAEVGQTNIVFFDSDGQQIAAYDIAVTRDLNGIRAALKQTDRGPLRHHGIAWRKD